MSKLNENRRGYKKTKVGWIPQEWESMHLGDCLERIVGGGTPSKNVSQYWDGNIPWATVKDLSKGNVFDTIDHITESGLKNSASNLIPANTIIISTRMAVGACMRFTINVAINQDLKALIPINKLSNDFLFWLLIYGKYKLAKLGTGSTVDGIRIEDLNYFLIPLPPLPEQNKIAEILSEWDRAIEQTSKLITAKTKLKKTLMQQLLKGERRFKEFGKPPKKKGELPDGWDNKPLGSFGSFLKGKGITNSEKKDSGFPCITYGEIYTKHNFIIKEFHSFINAETARTSQRIKNNDILFAGSGETLDEIGKCVAFTKDVEAYAGGDIVIFRPDKGYSNYLSYVLNSDFIIRQRRKLGQGHSVVHIYSSGIKTLKVPIPSLPEQRKISKVFNACGQEIELLNKKRDKLQDHKKGLMQKLLTGEVRVKVTGRGC